MIIHISGASGSGKTTLGNRLKKYFGQKITVKDIDDLRKEFMTKYEKTNISVKKFERNFNTLSQKYIDDYICKHNRKPIVFVGLNIFINKETLGFKKQDIKPKWLLNTHADYKFYIKLDNESVIRQRWDREYVDFIDRFHDYMIRSKDIIYKDILKNEKKAKKEIVEYITDIMSFDRTRKHMKRWDSFYKRKGYTFLSRKDIYKRAIKLLKS